MKKKTYTREFKAGAARMVVRENEKASKVARDLGVSNSALTKWIRDFKQHGDGAFPGRGFLAPSDEKVRELERKLRRAEMERDLLKKTIAFFAEQERKGTSL